MRGRIQWVARATLAASVVFLLGVIVYGSQGGSYERPSDTPALLLLAALALVTVSAAVCSVVHD